MVPAFIPRRAGRGQAVRRGGVQSAPAIAVTTDRDRRTARDAFEAKRRARLLRSNLTRYGRVTPFEPPQPLGTDTDRSKFRPNDPYQRRGADWHARCQSATTWTPPT